MKKRLHMFSWLKLDNAAIIYPSITDKKNSNIYRVSAYLTEPVDLDALNRILPRVMDRFPFFSVYLRRGFFWYYFEHTSHVPEPVCETAYPCQALKLKKSRFLFRIIPYSRRISVESSHILSDGFGITTFLKTLVCEYIKEKYRPDGDWNYPYNPSETVTEEEFADPFARFRKTTIRKPQKKAGAYIMPFARFKNKNRYHVIRAEMPLDQMKQKARELGVSLNDFLVALHLYAIQMVYLQDPRVKKKRLPIRAVVPVNLRTLFPHKSLRNFSFMVDPDIDTALGVYSFREVLDRVHHFIRLEASRKQMIPHINRNVNAQYNVLVRLLVRQIKDMVLRAAYYSIGEPVSSSISNLGLIRFPEYCSPYVERMGFTPAPSNSLKINLGVVSCNNILAVNFGKRCADTLFERMFFRQLAEFDIPVKIDTNWS